MSCKPEPPLLQSDHTSALPLGRQRQNGEEEEEDFLSLYISLSPFFLASDLPVPTHLQLLTSVEAIRSDLGPLRVSMFLPIPNFTLKAFLQISGNGGGSAGSGGGRFPSALAPAPHSAVVAVTALAGIAVFAAIFYTTSR
ncbi:hypothetical protein LINGRAHAP2_LOCUS33184 [Linum grandiflorum]